ncbi:MAG TPA: metallophosphoesterase [Oceanipulchritudo sp.]|nr:metallophosphoesterase [Oceanipulchritudo sp.]
MHYGATVSDLHLFSHHSRPRRYLEQIRETAAGARVFVLNGDIFDFKWSEHGVFKQSVIAARQFLESLLEAAPDCRFHVTLGNHDAVHPYMACLEGLSRKHENLYWHEFSCTIEDRIFLHGDVIHAGANNEALRVFRGRLTQPANRRRLNRVAHLAVHRSHVPGFALRMVPKRLLAARLLTYLENEDRLNGSGVRHVYFGHTHNAFEDFRYRGYTFHNCGSATHGAWLRVVTFPLHGDGT